MQIVPVDFTTFSKVILSNELVCLENIFLIFHFFQMECSNWGRGTATKLFRRPGLCHCHSTNPLYKRTHFNSPAISPASRPANKSSFNTSTHRPVSPASQPSSWYVANTFNNLARNTMWTLSDWKDSIQDIHRVQGEDQQRGQATRWQGRRTKKQGHGQERAEGIQQQNTDPGKRDGHDIATVAKIKTWSAPKNYRYTCK